MVLSKVVKCFQSIRNFVGDLHAIRLASRYAARLGQGFSTTTSAGIIDDRKICTISDIRRGQFCFSDGVGMISATLAENVSTRLGIESRVPSAFQVL